VPYSQWYLFKAIPDTNHNASPTNPNCYSKGNPNVTNPTLPNTRLDTVVNMAPTSQGLPFCCFQHSHDRLFIAWPPGGREKLGHYLNFKYSSDMWWHRTSSSAIAGRQNCRVSKLWQKYKREKRASNIALSYDVDVIGE